MFGVSRPKASPTLENTLSLANKTLVYKESDLVKRFKNDKETNPRASKIADEAYIYGLYSVLSAKEVILYLKKYYTIHSVTNHKQSRSEQQFKLLKVSDKLFQSLFLHLYYTHLKNIKKNELSEVVSSSASNISQTYEPGFFFHEEVNLLPNSINQFLNTIISEFPAIAKKNHIKASPPGTASQTYKPDLDVFYDNSGNLLDDEKLINQKFLALKEFKDNIEAEKSKSSQYFISPENVTVDQIMNFDKSFKLHLKALEFADIEPKQTSRKVNITSFSMENAAAARAAEASGASGSNSSATTSASSGLSDTLLNQSPISPSFEFYLANKKTKASPSEAEFAKKNGKWFVPNASSSHGWKENTAPSLASGETSESVTVAAPVTTTRGTGPIRRSRTIQIHSPLGNDHVTEGRSTRSKNKKKTEGGSRRRKSKSKAVRKTRKY